MAKASDFFGTATQDGVLIPADASTAAGAGWLIDPALNTDGVKIYVLVARSGSSGSSGWIGSDKAVHTNNKQFFGNTWEGAISLADLTLPAGEGFYSEGVSTWVVFDYLSG
ncbi:hypothetical protein [Kordiimonas sp.]|uniref:hypothetical protein n=1 Tax=Kordiimonas sp. TaxID=1970157 RepID=UPI003A94510B